MESTVERARPSLASGRAAEPPERSGGAPRAARRSPPSGAAGDARRYSQAPSPWYLRSRDARRFRAMTRRRAAPKELCRRTARYRGRLRTTGANELGRVEQPAVSASGCRAIGIARVK